jgi:hypothetical protein
MSRTRELNTRGVVTEGTPANLILAGWKTDAEDLRYSYNSLWQDPRTGQVWSISQAEAIRRDRQAPRYKFTFK